MRSQQKWWFLSEADKDQPGTDRDIDYYQHKSKEHEETEPLRLVGRPVAMLASNHHRG
jgi:ubiquitin carboxyl-terminal hydrolase 9/24